MFTKAISIFALAAAIANAYTTPKNGPLGNPISKPGLNEPVPVGKEYTITWTPTTPQDGTVTLLLLRGPSENIQPLYPIVENIKNTGSYTWTPKTDLEPDVTRYGIQLIVDADGQYQWSTQFGISNPSFSGSASGSASASASGSGSSGNSTASATATGSASATSSRVASTGFSSNSSIVAPTKSLSVPSSLKTESTTTGAATSARASAAATGAAMAVQAGGSLVMAGLGLAAALL